MYVPRVFLRKSLICRVCAIIATRNHRALLHPCLKALLTQRQPLQGIVVVDNASSDGTPQMLTEEFPTVRLLGPERNTGAAGAFKVGIIPRPWLTSVGTIGIRTKQTMAVMGMEARITTAIKVACAYPVDSTGPKG